MKDHATKGRQPGLLRRIVKEALQLVMQSDIVGQIETERSQVFRGTSCSDSLARPCSSRSEVSAKGRQGVTGEICHGSRPI